MIKYCLIMKGKLLGAIPFFTVGTHPHVRGGTICESCRRGEV